MTYLGRSPTQGVRNRYYKTASGGETSISGALTGGTLTFTDGNYVDVNLNGVTLVAGTDYNTSTANTIAGLSALTANDVVEIVVYDVFSVFSGNVNSDFSIGGNLTVTGTTAFTGAITSSAGATITTDDNAPQLTLKSTDADANKGPVLDLQRDSSSPAADDVIGLVRFRGEDAGSNITNYATISSTLKDPTEGSEDGELSFSVMKAGTDTETLLIDSGGIDITGALTATAASTITTADNTVQLTLKSTDADGSLGPKFDLTRDSSSPANGDNCGQINFKIDNDAGESTQYGDIFVGATNVADGSESAHMTFSTMKGGSRNSRMKLHSDETVFNEDSVDVDFRVESNGSANMLFVDGGNDAVGINTNSPHTTSKLHVFESSRNGGYAINTSYDTFIVEGETHVGLSICGGSNNSGSAAIAFPNGSSSIDGLINYEHAARSLQFHSGGSERARFLSGGNFLLGKTAENIGTAGVELGASGYLQATRGGSSAVFLNRLSSDGTIILMQRENSTVGTISVTSSSTAYNTSSDRRLKSNIQDAASVSTKIDAIQVRQFDWNVDGSHQDYGLIAQELEPIAPIAICRGDDDDEMMSVDYSKLVPMLIKAVQELKTELDAAKTRIATLEAK